MGQEIICLLDYFFIIYSVIKDILWDTRPKDLEQKKN